MSETAKNTPEDLQDVNAEETASEEVAAEATEEVVEDAAPQDPIAALEAEVAELKDRLLRQAAEVENTRRRAKKDVLPRPRDVELLSLRVDRLQRRARLGLA